MPVNNYPYNNGNEYQTLGYVIGAGIVVVFLYPYLAFIVAGLAIYGALYLYRDFQNSSSNSSSSNNSHNRNNRR